MNIWRGLLSLTLMLILLNGCAPRAAPSADMQSLVFMAGYKPQANLPFVGVYVAKEKGFFTEEGLDVTVEHSPGRGEHLQLVATGKVHITTQDAAILLQRRADPGLPLVSIALIGQKGQQAFAALSDSGMQSPKDWEGRTVGYKGTPPPELFALMGAAGTDQQAVELVNVGFDPRLLTERKVDVYPVYNSNEPYLIRSWGYDLILWEGTDYGVPTLGLTYVTSDTTLAEKPEALRKFLAAAIRGIEYAREHPDEAIDMVMKYAGPETDPDHMRFMLDVELQDAVSAITEEHGLGWQTKEQWQAMAELLQEYADLPEVNVEEVFTLDLLK